MVFSCVVMALIVLFMLAGVLPAPGGMQAVLFRSPVFIVLCALLLGALLYCCGRRMRRGRRRIAFVLLHLGVAMILIGGFVGHVAGRRTNVVLPLDGRAISGFQTADQQSFFQTGFAVSASDFEVEFHDPDYLLYRPPTGSGDEFELVKTIRFQNGRLDLDELGEVTLDELRNDRTGEWLFRKMLRNGWVLQRANLVARRYGVRLHFNPLDPADDEATTSVQLAVNHPAEYRGWRFYLMSYDVDHRRYVVTTMRRDPGRAAVIPGLWMTIVGAALSCLRIGRTTTTEG